MTWKEVVSVRMFPALSLPVRVKLLDPGLFKVMESPSDIGFPFNVASMLSTPDNVSRTLKLKVTTVL